jgi:hypothetical protein
VVVPFHRACSCSDDPLQRQVVEEATDLSRDRRLEPAERDPDQAVVERLRQRSVAGDLRILDDETEVGPEDLADRAVVR